MSLPVFPDRRISFSGIESLKRCPKQYFLSGPGAWNGWYDDATEQVKTLYIWKQIDGVFSWVGKLFHEWTTQVDFNEVDKDQPLLTKVIPLSDEELRERFWIRFDAQWQESESMSLEEWFNISREERKNRTFLLQHALKLGPAEAPSKTKIRNWIKPSIDNYMTYRSEFLGGASYSDWLVIEGRKITNGIIITDDKKRSQFSLRNERVHPVHELQIAGETWKFGYDMDRVVRFRENGEESIIILDLKTGKKKESHFKQIFLYAALASIDLPELKSFPLYGQLSYTNYNPQEGVVRFKLGPRELEEGYQFAVDAITHLRRHLKQVKDLETKALMAILPKQLYHLASWEETDYVFLSENFPADSARRLDLMNCRLCDKLKLCPEGMELVSVSF
ncbi:MAG TPA: PD-(D/E)XK nuclease family protein [Oligoflexia bacterium]|nr:PD-(D/E)XK nuclease family protein [Oligoflexia bacterium]HMP48038.1 PD-(D/E)XK nuclease family protein [Oligoflexia bacterium]